MYYNILKIKEIANLDEERIKKLNLLEDNECSFNILSIKKDEIIDTHSSHKNSAVYIVEGEIELHFEAEKFELKKGDLLLFKKDTPHKVFAKKDSKFMLIKI